jgi:hypothetical protein
MVTYFCDGISDITILNGVVRLEFQRLEAVQRGQSQNRELRAVPEFAVALPVESFILALQVLEKAHDQLFREGTMDADRSSDTNDHPIFPRERSPNFP